VTIDARRPEILALIPARGGSKGIPRKNLRVLAGKPLVAYSIEQALASRHITRTIVSTDDGEIAEVARRYGAEVPFMRPAEFARDASLDLDVFRHALEWLRDRQGYRCELVVHLRPTAPVRRVSRVDEAIELMLARPDAHALRSVGRPKQSPFKMWRLAGEHMEPLLPLAGVAEPHSMPRQALPEAYWQNGYVDVVRPDVVLTLGLMAGHRTLPFVVDEPVPELDYEEDIPRLEEALISLRRGEWTAPAMTGPRHSA
jgi:CMP-N,N'-diacetyllegionaminic acid synthase